MFRDHSLEHRMARIAWFVGGNSRRHECTLRTNIEVMDVTRTVIYYSAHMYTVQEA
jgi:hypothetical protein